MLRMSWQDAFEESFKGSSAAARQLHPRWRKAAPREAKGISPASLATRIGTLLKQGDPTGWWSRHPKLVQLLAQALGVERGEVLGSPGPPTGALGFPEFPRLPPLAPGEAPCRISRDGWLLQVVLERMGRSERAWVHAPAGSGKSLVVRYLQAHHGDEVTAASVRSISAAATLADVATPLVVEVEAAEPARDLEALGPLAERSASMIMLAPFPFPETSWYGPRDRVGSEAGWTTVDAFPTGDWRERLVAWVDARLETSDRDTRLQRDDVLAWLEHHDRLGRLVATPGDVLALCADFDAHGDDDSDLVERGRRWLEEVGATLLPADAPPTWRRHAATKAYRSSAVAHLHDTSQAFGSVDAEEWCGLVPADVSPPVAGDTPGATLTIGYLWNAGLLRGGPGGLVLYPTWVAHAAMAEALMIDFEAASLAKWGCFAADTSRQAAIDNALDALPATGLRTLVRKVAAHGTPGSLAELGAVESTLAAMGRRIERGELNLDQEDVAAAQKLVLLQVDALVLEPGYKQVHYPFTRREYAEWYATGWAVSLHVPRPEGFDRDDLAWELPGWAKKLDLAKVPKNTFPSSTVDPWRAEPNVQRVAALACEVINLMRPGTVPAETHRLLLPALFLSTPDWQIGHAHLDHLHGAWDEQFLAARCEKLAPERRTAVAGRIWTLAGHLVVADGAAPVAQRIQLLQQRTPRLAAFVLESVAPDEVARTASAFGIHRQSAGRGSFFSSDPQKLLGLPRATRQAALRAWLDGARERGATFDEARELVPLLDADDIEVALDLVRGGDRMIAVEFTSFVWKRAPARARKEARLAIEAGLPSAEGWFWQAPRSELHFLGGLIVSLPTPPAWTSKWAMHRVLDGGDAAEELYVLAQVANA
ncbi:MAG: hypothetical protein AABZ30_06735 [Myxococcota bacterium]